MCRSRTSRSWGRGAASARPTGLRCSSSPSTRSWGSSSPNSAWVNRTTSPCRSGSPKSSPGPTCYCAAAVRCAKGRATATSSSTTPPVRPRRGRRALDLTPAEYRLLRHLLVNAERVLSKEQICRHVWGETRAGNAIEKLVSRLRHKVDQEQPPLIHTRRGFGYRLGR
ncbi:winged helix-turn-helix domain-containing protein [Streptomyces umbrinus]|uniref:winged helix-turn-helix domain-containing protein n=1 Tax=Streptomyces umbrinus TaxID=67370 RepID=UPI0027D87156|nr:winged helix-turn-helix domain-containing protein [Streptomyces umbrinus]